VQCAEIELSYGISETAAQTAEGKEARILNDKPLGDFHIAPKAIEDFARAIRMLGAALISTFGKMAVDMEKIVEDFRLVDKNVFELLSVLPLWSERRRHEHPLDWIERVGAGALGYNIRPGERWRFETLRDWWAADDIPDEYGRYYPKAKKDLWSE